MLDGKKIQNIFVPQKRNIMELFITNDLKQQISDGTNIC